MDKHVNVRLHFMGRCWVWEGQNYEGCSKCVYKVIVKSEIQTLFWSELIFHLRINEGHTETLPLFGVKIENCDVLTLNHNRIIKNTKNSIRFLIMYILVRQFDI